MQQKISLKLLPSEAIDESLIKKLIAQSCSKKETEIKGFRILKRSIDARGKTVWINLTVTAFINEPPLTALTRPFTFSDISKSTKKVIVIGAGPAGLFAALKLIEQGIKPVVLERGKDVKARRRDLALLNKKGIINPESNYCFGEGGAGTYSDGKLYTRSSKRGDVARILDLFVSFGADENILYDAHPHIGTNKLPQIITTIRDKIIECGGEFLFEQKVIDFVITNDNIKAVRTNSGSYEANAYILATGHSARDIFTLLHNKKILIQSKPFAMGVRVEHPQELIDRIQYGPLQTSSESGGIPKLLLPPASYGLVHQVDNKGVFSFCMCPGGIIAPASTGNGELVVNGWSPSKRNNPFANSGIVVQVEQEDVLKLKGDWKASGRDSPFLLMEFQKMIEQKAFAEGGGKFVAPAQRLVDFTTGKISGDLPVCSYLPGISPAEIKNILPDFITERLQAGFRSFGKKMKGYLTNEAVIVAAESRSSSPVRIPRDTEKLHHPQVKNLYPCGEGAGYAGGIVSAAMDGERIATMLGRVIK